MHHRWQQDVILDVEYPSRVVAAFEEGAKAREVEHVVSEHGSVERSPDMGALAAHVTQNARQVSRRHGVAKCIAQGHPGFVGRFPDLAGQCGANDPRIVSRRFDQRHHARRVGSIAQHEIDHGVRIEVLVSREKVVARAHRADDRYPLVRNRSATASARFETRLPPGGRCFRCVPGSETSSRDRQRFFQGVARPRLPRPRCPWFRRPGSN